MNKNSISVFFFTAFSITLSAQSTRQYTNNTDAWFAYTGTHKIADKWSLHLEFQLRRNDFVNKPMQILPRVGINYQLNPQTLLTAGYAFVETYPYGEFAAKSTFPESRLWEQMQLKNQVGNFEWVSRFRLEQRFVQAPVLKGDIYAAGDAVFTNRFRLLNRFSIPFKGTTIGDKSYYFTVFDEFMINFGKNVALNVFDQNRLFLGIGYKIPKVGRLEGGYLNQQIIKSDGKKVENNHTLSVAFNCNIDFKKPAAK